MPMYDDDDFDDDNEEVVYSRCRACGAVLFDDETVRCPSCGSYQSEETDPAPRHSGWIIFTAIVMLVLILYAIVKH
jgi:ribosomal protein L37E